MAMSDGISLAPIVAQRLQSDLNTSETGRCNLTLVVAELAGCNIHVGKILEEAFTSFWTVARKADDMMDYQKSSDRKWLQVLQHLFTLCSKIQTLSSDSTLSSDTWLRVVDRFFTLMSKTCKGEVDDLLLRDKREVSESDYNRIVSDKTGTWFTGRVTCSMIASGIYWKEDKQEMVRDLEEYGELVSLSYQIRNDIRDAELEKKDGKVGKINYPAVMMLKNGYRYEEAIEMAEKKAASYETKARDIARKYSKDLVLLTSLLCFAD